MPLSLLSMDRPSDAWLLLSLLPLQLACAAPDSLPLPEQAVPDESSTAPPTGAGTPDHSSLALLVINEV